MMDDPGPVITEAEWLAGAKVGPLFAFLRDNASDRKLRLLACAYCRSEWGLLGRASRRAIILGEEMADGSVPKSRRDAVIRAAIEAVMRFPSMCGDRFFAADRAYRVPCNDGQYAVEWTMLNGSLLPGAHRIARDLFGNPFRAAPIEPGCLTPAVIELARLIYAERAFDRVTSLGDALADAGCTDPAVLDHCRGSGEHVVGCWVVDAILGKV